MALPLAQRQSSPLLLKSGGVLTGPKTFLAGLVALFTGRLDRGSGYVINAPRAIEALALHNPEAAQWWREHTPHMLGRGRYFFFHDSVGYVTDSALPAVDEI